MHKHLSLLHVSLFVALLGCQPTTQLTRGSKADMGAPRNGADGEPVGDGNEHSGDTPGGSGTKTPTKTPTKQGASDTPIGAKEPDNQQPANPPTQTPTGSPTAAVTKQPDPPKNYLQSQTAQQVNYKNYRNGVESLFAWRGTKVVFYTIDNAIQASTANSLVGHLEACLKVYEEISDRPHPLSPDQNFGNVGSVADVADTCGAGCGLNTHAEIQRNEFNRIKSLGLDKPGSLRLMYYELARGSQYAFYPQLEPLPAPVEQWFGASFPLYITMQCMRATGTLLTGDLRFGNCGNADGLRKCFNDSSLSYLDIMTNKNNPIGANNLGGMIFDDLHMSLGPTGMRTFFKELQKEPKAQSYGDGACNMARAASRAAGKNMKAYFEQTWRFPNNCNVP